MTSTLALSKSPNCNKRTVFWHKIVTTLRRWQKLLYSLKFSQTLLLSLIHVRAWTQLVSRGREQMLTYLSWSLMIGVFSPFRLNWYDQNNVLSSYPTQQRHPELQQSISKKNKQEWHHEAQRPPVSTPKLQIEKGTTQLGWLQMKASFSLGSFQFHHKSQSKCNFVSYRQAQLINLS